MADLIERLRGYAEADDLHVDERATLLEAAAALEAAREDACVALVADIRFACGDNGKRMQPELVEFIRELAADAERLDWLDTQRSDDVQGSYPDEPQLVWHYWDIDSPDCTDVRDAIDQARGKGGAGK